MPSLTNFGTFQTIILNMCFYFQVKLLSRAQRVAYYLLNKTGTKSEPCLKIGDRVALVFPNNDPIGFTIAYCGCIMAGLVAIPIDLPVVKRDTGCHNLGFVIGQVGATVALASETCYRSLPKSTNGDCVEIKSKRIVYISLISIVAD
jgi:acyl-CoA synthetase (AMP-forming)/AMP-acid ligase II